MKRELRRIEETLNQLTIKASSVAIAPTARSLQPSTTAQSLSFEVQARSSRSKSSQSVVPSSSRAAFVESRVPDSSASEVVAHRTVTLEVGKAFVQPFTVEPAESKTPNLPKLKSPTFTSHRNGTNPALASSLLKEIQVTVDGWQAELHQVLRQIQDLYLEGPIVDGWLESHSREPEVDFSTLRHAEVDRLLDYVEELCSNPDQQVACETPRTGYRLCGLNADGQLWSCPCPPEQVPSLSLAIARHQKLRQLLNRKQHLETRLNQLAETLVVVHSHLQELPADKL